jgi:hypothetical protein
MSRLTLTRYRDLEAERRREVQREIKRLRKELQRCIRLEDELAQLEAVEPRKYAELLSQLNSSQEAIAEAAPSSQRREWLGRVTSEAT